MQVTTAQKINKHHEAVIPNYRGTRCKANRQRKPYLRSPIPQRNGVKPWDMRQVFRSVWQHHAEDKCPGNRAGRRFIALGIGREQGCPKPFCNIASEGRTCNVEESVGGTMLSEPSCNIASEGRTCNAKGRRGKSSVSAPLWNIASEGRTCNAEEQRGKSERVCPAL